MTCYCWWGKVSWDSVFLWECERHVLTESYFSIISDVMYLLNVASFLLYTKTSHHLWWTMSILSGLASPMSLHHYGKQCLCCYRNLRNNGSCIHAFVCLLLRCGGGGGTWQTFMYIYLIEFKGEITTWSTCGYPGFFILVSWAKFPKLVW